MCYTKNQALGSNVTVLTVKPFQSHAKSQIKLLVSIEFTSSLGFVGLALNGLVEAFRELLRF